MVYEIVGSREKAVAIIGYGTKNPNKLAKEIMKRHKNVKSVLVKTGQREGVYRTHPAVLLLGDKNTEVIHKEHGYQIKVDPQKAYFSPRESTERQRIAKMVKAGERVLIMFSGVGPYTLAIKKEQPKAEIITIEINPYAVSYANKNVKLNKMTGIYNYLADVKDVLIGDFDRIIMPLPELAIDYLDTAFNFSKKGTVIHVYGFGKSPKELTDKIKEKSKDFNFKYRILKKQKVLPYGPGIYKYRIDIKIT